MHLSLSLVALTHLVSDGASPVSSPILFCSGGATASSTSTDPPHSAETHSVAGNLIFSIVVQNVLLNARKPSTRRSYLRKWKHYLSYLSSYSITNSSLCSILDFLLYLKDLGLGLSSLRVYLSATSSHHHPLDGKTVFSYPLSKQFLQGLRNLHPVTWVPLSAWKSACTRVSFGY